jgi:hypothetical protein
VKGIAYCHEGGFKDQEESSGRVEASIGSRCNLELFITNKANQQEQKNAIADISSGKAKGNGHFALFASTVKYLLDLTKRECD